MPYIIHGNFAHYDVEVIGPFATTTDADDYCDLYLTRSTVIVQDIHPPESH